MREVLHALSESQAELLRLAESQHEQLKNAILRIASDVQEANYQDSSPFKLKLEQRTAQPWMHEALESVEAPASPEPLPRDEAAPVFEGLLTGDDLEGLEEPRSKATSHALSLVNSLGGLLADAPETDPGRSLFAKMQLVADYATAVLVCCHVVLLMMELEFEGQQNGISVGGGPVSVDMPFRSLDAVFDIAFLADFILRWVLGGWAFCRSWVNWLDGSLTVSSVVDLIFIAAQGGATKPNDAALLHVIRAAASLRLLRFCKFFNGIRMLLKACTSFLPSLFWAMAFLMIFMLVGTLMIGNLLQQYIVDVNSNLEDRYWLWERYGTAYRALYSMYEITFAGNWPSNVRPVLTGASHFFVIFFVAYVTIIVFAVLRVITAVFLKDSLDTAQSDADHQLRTQLRRKAEYTEKLEIVFQAIDETGNGIITEDRLKKILENPKVKAYFQTLDLDVHEGAALFHLLDNGDGEVTLDEFIDGVLRCKGPARAIDQLVMQADLRQITAKMSKLIRAVGSLEKTQVASSPAEHLRVFRWTTHT